MTRARSKRKRACPDPSEASKGTRTTHKLFFSPKAEFKETLAHPLHTSPKSALHTTPFACRRRLLKIQQRHFLSFISFFRAFSFLFLLSFSSGSRKVFSSPRQRRFPNSFRRRGCPQMLNVKRSVKRSSGLFCAGFISGQGGCCASSFSLLLRPPNCFPLLSFYPLE